MENIIYRIGQRLTGVDCLIGGCPAVYEANKSQIGVPQRDCLIGGCPGIIPQNDGYVVIGDILSREQIESAGLAGKVAEHEAAVFVHKGIIDELKKV